MSDFGLNSRVQPERVCLCVCLHAGTEIIRHLSGVSSLLPLWVQGSSSGFRLTQEALLLAEFQNSPGHEAHRFVYVCVFAYIINIQTLLLSHLSTNSTWVQHSVWPSLPPARVSAILCSPVCPAEGFSEAPVCTPFLPDLGQALMAQPPSWKL